MEAVTREIRENGRELTERERESLGRHMTLEKQEARKEAREKKPEIGQSDNPEAYQ
jgi:hypothetical protein